MRRSSKLRIPFTKFKSMVKGGSKKGFYAPWHQRALKGKRTGLSGAQFCVHIFALNEHFPPEEKLTDYDIVDQLKEEFPNSTLAKANVPGSGITINSLRNKYNRGVMDRWGIPPERKSFRYNEFGIIVDGSYGKKIIPAETIEKEIRIHKGKRLKAIKEFEKHKQQILDAQDKLLREKERKKEAVRRAILSDARRVKKLKLEGWKKVKRKTKKEIVDAIKKKEQEG